MWILLLLLQQLANFAPGGLFKANCFHGWCKTCAWWIQIAFSSISLALQYYVADMQSGQYRLHHGVVSKQPGSGPNEAGRFQLQDHFAVRTEVPVLDSKL